MVQEVFLREARGLPELAATAVVFGGVSVCELVLIICDAVCW